LAWFGSIGIEPTIAAPAVTPLLCRTGSTPTRD
jgi:hypothetical protein